MKIFLSHSFDKEDGEVIKWFANLITSIEGVEVITARKPELKMLWDKISGKIEESMAVVGILTRDEKIEGKNKWKTKDWILSELGYSYGRGLPTFAFIEEGVPPDGIVQIKEYVFFKRGKEALEKTKKEALDYLTSVLKPFKDRTYNFETWEKQSHIFNNFHGIEEHIITLCVTSNRFSKIRHSFGLSNLPKNIQLLSWNKLQTNEYRERFEKAIFFARILDDFRKERKINIKEDPQSNGPIKNFFISFTPNLKPGEKVKYGWGWSSPKMFFPWRKKYNETALKTFHPVKELIFKLFFDKGFPLSGVPIVKIVDQNGNSLGTHNFVADNELCYTKFTWKFDRIYPNATYKCHWKVRNK